MALPLKESITFPMPHMAGVAPWMSVACMLMHDGLHESSRLFESHSKSRGRMQNGLRPFPHV